MDTGQRSSPFPHQLIAPIFENRVEGVLLDLLDSFEWERRETGFYRFDIPTLAQDRARTRDVVSGSKLLNERRSEFERVFDCRLSQSFRLEIHRYVDGCGIGPHTDAGTPEVRFVMNLNRAWKPEDGGVWILSSDLVFRRDCCSYLPSLSNTGFVFSTSKASYHALSTYSAGTIYGLTLRLPRSAANGLDG
jgi:hypothetical protein